MSEYPIAVLNCHTQKNPDAGRRPHFFGIPWLHWYPSDGFEIDASLPSAKEGLHPTLEKLSTPSQHILQQYDHENQSRPSRPFHLRSWLTYYKHGYSRLTRCASCPVLGFTVISIGMHVLRLRASRSVAQRCNAPCRAYSVVQLFGQATYLRLLQLGLYFSTIV